MVTNKIIAIMIWKFSIGLRRAGRMGSVARNNFVITTTFRNCDEKWIEEYIERLSREQPTPMDSHTMLELKARGCASYKSKDPDSDVTAETTYEITRGIR